MDPGLDKIFRIALVLLVFAVIAIVNAVKRMKQRVPPPVARRDFSPEPPRRPPSTVPRAPENMEDVFEKLRSEMLPHAPRPPVATPARAAAAYRATTVKPQPAQLFPTLKRAVVSHAYRSPARARAAATAASLDVPSRVQLLLGSNPAAFRRAILCKLILSPPVAYRDP